ncbi:hypothetical protein T4D_15758 [Trichinella pseudospiralis]|uniref:Uncharacterized protein n=1 Tax=Trichinella pseudospiralis TaxID=6337 RepID=A0A0V1F337_TRIPS|nr:hypothetical protein T4D_15758 [Trichinella pseudospiralis]
MTALLSLKFHYNQLSGEYSLRRAISKELRLILNQHAILHFEDFEKSILLNDSNIDNRLYSAARDFNRSSMPALMSLKFHYNQFTGEYSERRVIFQERRVSVE